MVSVICTTYNHERYLRKALEGFVTQKTGFSFEVIVHDDASTDGTRSIIEEYVEKYPDIFVPIYQKENQHSQGILILRTHIMPRVRGKYVAFCEGDDFWCDDNKLQVQFDYMEGHPDCSMCVHNSGEINDAGEDLGTRYGSIEEACELPLITVLGRFREKVFQTASFFLRAKHFLQMPEDLFPKGEYLIASYMAFCGKVYYMPEVMAYYRILSKGSWTALREGNLALRIQDQFTVRARLVSWDDYTNGAHATIFQELEEWVDYSILMLASQQLLPRLSLKKRLKVTLYSTMVALGILESVLQCRRKLRKIFHAKH